MLHSTCSGPTHLEATDDCAISEPKIDAQAFRTNPQIHLHLARPPHNQSVTILFFFTESRWRSCRPNPRCQLQHFPRRRRGHPPRRSHLAWSSLTVSPILTDAELRPQCTLFPQPYSTLPSDTQQTRRGTSHLSPMKLRRRTAIFLCLLHGTSSTALIKLSADRPLLHPSLGALHRHRFQAHSIPLPADPTKDLPIKGEVGVGAVQGFDTNDEAKKEWLGWRLRHEEEARRKAYLPLN